MNTKKIFTLVISAVMLVAMLILPAQALSVDDGLDALINQFVKGQGPTVDGLSIDYRYYSPVKENDSTKYPVVVWLHGMGDGESDGTQVSKQEISLWASDEYQSRFKGSKGAYIFAPRSLEEKELYWSDSLIYPLRAAIDDFIAQNKDNVDISRIYVGGYSMGGKMTLKMAVAYPEFFAAAFPICPAWAPDEEAAAKLKDMPVWMTSGKMDPLVSYQGLVMPTWNNILATTNNPENCRLTSLSVTARPNGVPILSAHFSWIAVNNDMFSYQNGDYPFMSTIDGNGNTVNLTYPDGMISWLSSFSSDYDGTPATDSGNKEASNESGHLSFTEIVKEWLRGIIDYIMSVFNK